MKPLIGITIDRVVTEEYDQGRYQIGPHISRSVIAAGGVPVLMVPDAQLAEHYASACDGFVFTGGLDPDTAIFGEPMHPNARKMDTHRQSFETALLDALAGQTKKPVLGICLGMQMMALHAGGKLNQYMPDTMDKPEIHQKGGDHPVVVTVEDSFISADQAKDHEPIYSSHQQAVSDAGKMRITATAPDGTVEAIDGKTIDPKRFYLGVQWHPERGGDGPLNQGLFRRLLEAVAAST